MAQQYKHSSSANVAWVIYLLLSLLLVPTSLQGFVSGFSSFLPSTKPNISKLQFDQNRGPAKADVAFFCDIYFISFLQTPSLNILPKQQRISVQASIKLHKIVEIHIIVHQKTKINALYSNLCSVNL